MLFSTPTAAPAIAPGSRVLIRDAEWLVRKVDVTSNGKKALTVIGLSELVRDREAIFLEDLEPSIQLLRPEDTEFVADDSARYMHSLLYLESRLRQMPPTVDGLESRLHVGHRAAMDVLPYQLEPALQALDQPRQRILIADTVGLGKTLEAGILLSELMARGRAKRILVLTVKSMLTQFQKEMWNRFAIPLVRLDSVGLERVRAHIPTNHNPFYYYDKTIISIDTLKQNREYGVYLENAYWDVIVIDEAHHVAERGASSQRNKLAKLLASRSDTLVMLSATPHDGKARSFASLMNMLNPTAIANPDDYTPDDIKGLFIRRFKKDVADQVAEAFKPRTIAQAHAQATPAEEAAFDTLVSLQLAHKPRSEGGAMLFRTTLEKALFSSPAACLQTVRNRLGRLEAQAAPDAREIEGLKALARELAAVTPEKFAKYQKLMSLIRETMKWKGNDPSDRLVIFTERIETLNFLKAHLPDALGLKPAAVQHLHGGMADTEQQAVVEAFGQREHPLRLLIASDVASEGINLHYQCHRMIHFDVPWSLMVFQQRNGRIDRYGQPHAPEMYYLVTDSGNAKIKGDTRILELLIEKDKAAEANIGDPSALMGVYDVDLEEAKTALAMEQGLSPEAFASTFNDFDPLALLFGDEPFSPAANRPQDRIRPMLSLFKDDHAYARAGLQALQQKGLKLDLREEAGTLRLTMPEDLRDRYAQCPREVNPHPRPLHLTADAKAMTDAIAEARAGDEAWPALQYLWPLHPVMGWLNDKMTVFFERPRETRQDKPRHRAPVLRVPKGLAAGDIVYLLVGVLPNRKGHPLIQSWLTVTFSADEAHRVEDLATLIARTGLGQTSLANDGAPLADAEKAQLRVLLPRAIEAARSRLSADQVVFNSQVDGKLEAHLEALGVLRSKQFKQLDLDFGGKGQDKKAAHERYLNTTFDEYQRWIEDTMQTGDQPYLQVMAALVAQ